MRSPMIVGVQWRALITSKVGDGPLAVQKPAVASWVAWKNNVDFGQPGRHGTFYGQALQIESASFYVRRLGGGLDDVQTRRRL